MKSKSSVLFVILAAAAASAAEYHVSVNGDDKNDGSAGKPFRTISAAAQAAQPGDVITVHEGTYREHIAPPRGGLSDDKRIVYQAAAGEKVEIKGSEVIKNWVKVQDAVWKVTLPNSFFGRFNPYSDLIRGDWFNPKGRDHHTGAVYLNGEWLTEAAALDEVLAPPGTIPAWLGRSGGPYLLNVAWLRRGSQENAPRIPATSFAAKQGTQNAPCSEGGECIGFIEHGHWVRYDRFDFGERTERLQIRAASASEGGIIEVRLDSPQGELLGACTVPNTGGWQSWSTVNAKIKPVSGVRTLCLVFKSLPTSPVSAVPLWFAKVDTDNTTIWAQFKDVNPNEQLVEINVRRTVFYPEKPGINYITVRGFTMRHAATPWAPPTAEQIGLIGTHWSKGWVIENNVISHSICSGIALGKHGDEFDNTSANTAEGYVKTIERAHAFSIPWTGENIGHHVVRNNTISHCEQAGIVGSLGAIFSTITHNHIHTIWAKRHFTGAEMAGIKLHAAIDVLIKGNRIHNAGRGLWMDWMAQGTRITQNLLYDNTTDDLFVEVNHGPFLVDNNIFLSGLSLLDMSEGGAYAHNLFAGRILSRPELRRDTPYHPAHSTVVAGLVNTKGGDNRFYNNIFFGPVGAKAADYGLATYDAREYPLHPGGNVYYGSARPYAKETDATVVPDVEPKPEVVEKDDSVVLRLTLGPAPTKAATVLVTTERLGKAKIPNLAYENPDGSPVRINTDYFSKKRNETRPSPGPFEGPAEGRLELKVW
ncbi:MAG: carbohydrate-binding protein [Candidatus Sumerlaeia bacterium]|nr:carbohydrate-binding protein [Candidatus Sumerlaeia bacterium]